MICAAAYTVSWKHSDPSIYLVVMLKSETKHGQTVKRQLFLFFSITAQNLQKIITFMFVINVYREGICSLQHQKSHFVLFKTK